MSGKIIILSDEIKQKIAAGEVIEGAHSVVKELIENAIDAEATQISVNIENGGHSRIRITDNGSGISSDDLEMTIIEHATSKISSLEDLYQIKSMGFRGEALSSIASISYFQISSRTSADINGSFIRGSSGRILNKGKIPLTIGTEILIENLFFNTPARRKFLKTETAENRRIKELIQIFALAYPQIHFRLFADQKKIFDLQNRTNRLLRIGDLYGEDLMQSLIEISGTTHQFQINGFISIPSYHRLTRNMQFSFVNQRIVQIPHFSFLVSKGYSSFLESGHFPIVFLFIDIAPEEIDVNVHPTKKEIRFERNNELQSAIIHSISAHLYDRDWQRLKKQNIGAKTAIQDNFSGSLGRKPRFFSGTDRTKNTNYLIEKPANEKPNPGQNNFVKSNDINLLNFPISDISRNDYTIDSKLPPQKNLSIMSFQEDSLIYLGILAKKYILFETSSASEHSPEKFYNNAQENATKKNWHEKESLLLMDFHAAHERILFERLVQKRNLSGETISEQFLLPLTIDLAMDEIDNLEEHLEYFNTAGLEINIIGRQSVAIHRLPYFIRLENIQETLREIIAILSLHKIGDSDMEREFFRTKSCRSAIKAGYSPDQLEIVKLLADLSQCEEPTRCPHGRPIWTGFSLKDLDKLFKRIL